MRETALLAAGQLHSTEPPRPAAVESACHGRRINRLAIDHVLYAPLGVMLQHHAWRKNVSGIVQAPMPSFWGVSKTA
jgi:peptide/nickel transport system substrate-binding protein